MKTHDGKLMNVRTILKNKIQAIVSLTARDFQGISIFYVSFVAV